MASIHGGQIIARALRAEGVDTLFTLTGGHILPILDGCVLEGIRVERNADEGIDFDEEGAGDVVVRLGQSEARDNRSDGISVGEEGDGDLRAEMNRLAAWSTSSSAISVSRITLRVRPSRPSVRMT